MLLALRHPCPDTGALKLASGLDNAETIVEFRAALSTRVEHGNGNIFVDCAGITHVAPPVLGWLVSVGAELATAQPRRKIVLLGADPQFRLQLRTLGTACDLLVVSPRGGNGC